MSILTRRAKGRTITWFGPCRVARASLRPENSMGLCCVNNRVNKANVASVGVVSLPASDTVHRRAARTSDRRERGSSLDGATGVGRQRESPK